MSFSFLLLCPHPPPAGSQGGGSPDTAMVSVLTRGGDGSTATECRTLLQLSKHFSSWATSVCAVLVILIVLFSCVNLKLHFPEFPLCPFLCSHLGPRKYRKEDFESGNAESENTF